MTVKPSVTCSTPSTVPSARSTCSSKLERSGQPAIVSAITSSTLAPSISIERTMSSSTTERCSSGSMTPSRACMISSREGAIRTTLAAVFRPMAAQIWPNLSTRLEGRHRRLRAPRRARTATGLWAAAQDAEIWDWMPLRVGHDRGGVRRLARVVARRPARRRLGAVRDPLRADGRAGRQLPLHDAAPRARRARDRLHVDGDRRPGAPARTPRRSSCSRPRVRGSRLHAGRVQDGREERELPPRARGAAGASSRGSSASTCSCATASCATRPGTRSPTTTGPR